MKITSFEAATLAIPEDDPLANMPEEEGRTRPVVILTLHTDQGVSGIGITFYGGKLTGSLRKAVEELADLTIGEDPMRVEHIVGKIRVAMDAAGPGGIATLALSAIDIALWDIKGKVTGQPVWKLLGGARERVPAYITFGIGTYTQEQLVEVAKTLVAEGQDKLKMVVAARVNQFRAVAAAPTDEDISRDIERIRAVREAVGDAVELMIDANQSATYSQAARLAREAGPCNLTWFEDPIPQADPRLLAQLRRESPIPIATGSTGIFDLMQLREYLLNESVDYLQPNVRMIGGYTGALKAAALAQAFNVQLQMGGNWPHLNMHLHAGVPNGGRVEFHWGGWKAFAACFDGAPDPVKGWTTPPDKPGLGFTPKEGIVKEFATD